MFIQFILSIFIIFALSRVLIQVRSAKITLSAFLFWSALFILALVGVIDPKITSYIAEILGIGRGTDVVLYISIALLFYLIFRLSISLEEMRREITRLVREISLSQEEKIYHHKKRKRST